MPKRSLSRLADSADFKSELPREGLGFTQKIGQTGQFLLNRVLVEQGVTDAGIVSNFVEDSFDCSQTLVDQRPFILFAEYYLEFFWASIESIWNCSIVAKSGK